MGVMVHTLAIVTKKLKIFDISVSGERPTTFVSGQWMWGTRGYPYTE